MLRWSSGGLLWRTSSSTCQNWGKLVRNTKLIHENVKGLLAEGQDDWAASFGIIAADSKSSSSSINLSLLSDTFIVQNLQTTRGFYSSRSIVNHPTRLCGILSDISLYLHKFSGNQEILPLQPNPSTAHRSALPPSRPIFPSLHSRNVESPESCKCSQPRTQLACREAGTRLLDPYGMRRNPF